MYAFASLIKPNYLLYLPQVAPNFLAWQTRLLRLIIKQIKKKTHTAAKLELNQNKTRPVKKKKK